jgi:hypothetical protein
MRPFLIILILAVFIQSSFIPLNLVLVLLIVRVFVVEDTANYWFGLLSGTMLGILTSVNLGFWTLFFLLAVKLIYLIRKNSLTHNTFAIVPIAFIFCLLAGFYEKLFLSQTVNFYKISAEALITFPFYIFFRYWEERFIVKRDTKLKLRG